MVRCALQSEFTAGHSSIGSVKPSKQVDMTSHNSHLTTHNRKDASSMLMPSSRRGDRPRFTGLVRLGIHRVQGLRLRRSVLGSCLWLSLALPVRFGTPSAE